MRWACQHVLPAVCVALACAQCEAFLPGSHRVIIVGGEQHSRTGLPPLKAANTILAKDKLLKQAVYEGMDKEMAAKLLDAADGALRNWTTHTSGFLTPPEVAAMLRIFNPLADVEVASWGGYEQAERQRLFFSREGVLREELEAGVVALEVGGQFLFDMAEHKDYLGAIVGTGIGRDGVGDILVQGERGAQVLVSPSTADYLAGALSSVRTVTVKVRPIGNEELRVAPAVRKEVNSVEASLRLDAVASAGMSMSRSKMAQMVKGGTVLVNWKEASSSSYTVKQGDIITVRGKGRVEISEIVVTKKGKYKIRMNRTV